MDEIFKFLSQFMQNEQFMPGISPEARTALGTAFGTGMDYYNQNKAGMAAERMGIDTSKEIDPFRVNPTRGYLSFNTGGSVPFVDIPAEGTFPVSFRLPGMEALPQSPHMMRDMDTGTSSVSLKQAAAMTGFAKGGAAGMVPTVPASGMLDTINNTPSNIPGAPMGKLPLFPLGLQQNNPFALPKMQPFTTPTFGNDLPQFDTGGYTTDMFSGLYNLGTERGRRKQKRLEKLIKRANRGNENAANRLAGMVDEAKLNTLRGQGWDVNLDSKRNQTYTVTNPETGEVVNLDLDQKKGFGNQLWNTVKGVPDFSLSMLGMSDVIKGSFTDRSKFLSGYSNIFSKILPTALNFAMPGLGTGLSTLSGAVNSFTTPDQASGAGQGFPGTGGGSGMFDPSQFMAQNDGYSNPGSLFSAMIAGGGFGQGFPSMGTQSSPQTQAVSPFSALFPTGPISMGGNSGIGGGLFNILTGGGIGGGLFGGQYGGPVAHFSQGGMVQAASLVPIQTELGEKMIHLDGTITDVNATKLHKHMDDDTITDIVPQGTYIASADKKMKMKRKDAEDILIGIQAVDYKEERKGKLPEKMYLDIIFGDKKEMTPAEMVEAVKKKFPVIDREEKTGYNDIFTLNTNQENLVGRSPYISQIVAFNEKERIAANPEQFKDGGAVYHFPEGGMTGADWVNMGAQLLPGILQMFGGNKRDGYSGQPGQIDPLSQSYMLGSFPLYTQGVNANIDAQKAALTGGIGDVNSLGSMLAGYANQSAGGQMAANLSGSLAQMAATLGQDTSRPRADFSSQIARINNLSPRGATRAAYEARTTPQVDIATLARELGPQAGPVIAQVLADQRRAGNSAAMEFNQYLDNYNLNQANQVNDLSMRQQLLNNDARTQEIMARNQQTQNLGNLFANAGQRGADINTGRLGQLGNIASDTLMTTLGMNMDLAKLAGQKSIAAGQQAFNLGSALAALRAQNRMFAEQQQQSPVAGVPQTGDGKISPQEAAAAGSSIVSGMPNWGNPQDIGATIGRSAVANPFPAQDPFTPPGTPFTPGINMTIPISPGQYPSPQITGAQMVDLLLKRGG